MTLEELNAQDRAAFVSAVGWVFEQSAWIAERAWNRRPFASLGDLHGAMISQVRSATLDEQLGLLRAHPDLGTRAALSSASAAEQSGAGFDRMTAAESERFSALNAAYRDKFGFPFIYAVRSGAKHDILNALESRLLSDREAERGEALEQVFRIARFRLEDVL